jgi:DEAD/DEAH box helicase domain-containing protein
VRGRVRRAGSRALAAPGGAADAAHAGQHVVLATGTASGKSLGLPAAALTAIGRARAARQRGATVLYLAPTKALAQDQLAGSTALGLGRPVHHPRRRQPPRAAGLDARPRASTS